MKLGIQFESNHNNNWFKQELLLYAKLESKSENLISKT